MGPMPFDQLDYTPTHGAVDMRGDNKTWGMEVPIEQGRAMEADGIPVYWIAPDSELAKMEV